MSAPPGYFEYPHRRAGTDHGRFPHRFLHRAPPVTWPGGARIALWITVDVEHFPMDMPRVPFLPPGGMERPGVSFWDYTMRDYGNRVGIFRIFRQLDARGLRATAAMNAAVATRMARLLQEVTTRGWEVMAAGQDMAHLHHGQVPPEQERRQVGDALATLRALSGQPVLGWRSPAHSESAVTPDLVAEAGVEYLADWVNDDMPYALRAGGRELVHLPLTYELSDKRVLFAQNQPLEAWEAQVADAFDMLNYEAATQGGRILSLLLTPWVIGQPYRIAALGRVLDRILAQPGVWVATAGEIAAAWRGQAGGQAAA